MFADNTKVWKEVTSQDDDAALQQDLHSLSLWSPASYLAFYDKKCKLQSITTKCKSTSTSYEVNGRNIQSSEKNRNLDELVDCDLAWRAQVCHQAACTNKLLWYIRSNARYIRSISTRPTLYLGLVRAHLA